MSTPRKTAIVTGASQGIGAGIVNNKKGVKSAFSSKVDEIEANLLL